MAIGSTETHNDAWYDVAAAISYSFDSTNGFTWGGWFYVDDVTSFNNYLTFVRNILPNTFQTAILVGNTSSKFNFFSNSANGAAYSGDLFDASNGWTHIVYRMGAGGRVGGDTSVWDVFINGTKTTINAAFDGGMLGDDYTDGTSSFGILSAGSSATPSNATAGRCDEYYFWEKALSDGEIQAMASGYSFMCLNNAPTHAYSFSRFPVLDVGPGSSWEIPELFPGGNTVQLVSINQNNDAHAPGAGLIYPSQLFYPAAGSTAVAGRIMSSLVGRGGLSGHGGIAGIGGGLAG